jgi:hypothetical protein
MEYKLKFVLYVLFIMATCPNSSKVDDTVADTERWIILLRVTAFRFLLDELSQL